MPIVDCYWCRGCGHGGLRSHPSVAWLARQFNVEHRTVQRRIAALSISVAVPVVLVNHLRGIVSKLRQKHCWTGP